MFYKDNVLSDEEKEYFNYSPEFTYSLFKKVSIFPNYSLANINALSKEGVILSSYPIVMKSSSFDQSINLESPQYISIKGIRELGKWSRESIINHFQYKFPETHSLDINMINENDFLKQYILNSNKQEKSDKLLENFFNLKEIGTLQDKYGQNYLYKIISNADSSIGADLVIDELYLFDEISQQQIGFIKAKYTTRDYLKIQHINIDAVNSNMFLNTATIDYSKLSENYQNLGLGYSMYFKLTQYLNTNEISFRQSTLNSDSAKRLWSGINKHFSEFVEHKSINNKTVSFLNIGKDCILDFIDNKPVIKKKLKL